MPSLFQERLFAKSLLGVICVINGYCFAEDTGQSLQRMTEGIDRGRNIIATLQDEVFAELAYTQEELSLLKEDFRKDYFESVEPRLKDVSRYISGSAIHWVDVDWDGVEELVFWTEGLSTGWNIKEALFIVKVPQEDNPEKTNPTIILSCALDDPFPSTTSKGYRYVRFTPYPNADLGTNYFVRAILSYVQIGASGSAFGHFSIEYNRYEDKVEITKFSTPFPFIIEKDIFK